MMKNLLLASCLLLVFFSCSKRKNKKQNVGHSIHFKWHGATIGGKKYKRANIVIPVKIDTLNKTYIMQLDLGSPTNTFYGGILHHVIQHYPYLKEKISKRDTSAADIFPSVDLNDIIPNYNPNITWFNGPVSMRHSTYSIKIQGGEFFPKVNVNERVIGTIGVNQFKNKVLIIDFKNQTIRIRDSLNYDKLANNYSFTKFSLKGENRIVVKLKIGDKTIHAQYDTGALFMSIVTINQKRFNDLRSDSSSVDTLSIGTPYDRIKLYKSELGKNIYLGNTKLNGKDANVFYSTSRVGKYMSKSINVKYTIGNKFFFHKTIIIDFNKHKFGVSKSNH